MTGAFVFIALVGHYLATLLHGGLAFWMLQKQHLRENVHMAMMASLIMIALWAYVTGWSGATTPPAEFFETLRNGTLLFFMHMMLRSDESHSRPQTVGILYLVMACILVLQAVVDFSLAGIFDGTSAAESVFLLDYTSNIFRMIFAIGALVLVHNLYSIASPTARIAIRLPMTAIAIIWFYDLNLYVISYLTSDSSGELLAIRGLVTALTMPLFAFGVRRDGALKVQLSRSVAFHSFSLIAIGMYLIAMVLVVQLLSYFSGDFARLAEVSLIVTMSLAAIILLPSDQFRAWFKVKVAKHFFQHRYDYRAEWMRFADTIGRHEGGDSGLHRRVIKAVADITDSRSGLLLTPDDAGRLSLEAQWNWPEAEVPQTAFTEDAKQEFEKTGFIVELDSLRDATADQQPHMHNHIAPWLVDENRAWIVVPLIHYERLAGILVLGRPRISRAIDWEDLDMLRVAGRQAASYLAEERVQNALAEAQQFEDFNRRFAFVMHDLKNTVSQLSLISRNAKNHIDKAEFRADMLDTLDSAVNKLKETLSRLSNYRKNTDSQPEPVAIAELAREVAKQKSQFHPINLIGSEDIIVRADRASLEQVILHLLQNAIDASQSSDAAIIVQWYTDNDNGCIEIVDQGCGMSADFVRNKLFKPFQSQKDNGFGIGAFEAKALIAAMGGKLAVESREHIGTRMVIHLPLETALGGIKPTQDNLPSAEKDTNSRETLEGTA